MPWCFYLPWNLLSFASWYRLPLTPEPNFFFIHDWFSFIPYQNDSSYILTAHVSWPPWHPVSRPCLLSLPSRRVCKYFIIFRNTLGTWVSSAVTLSFFAFKAHFSINFKLMSYFLGSQSIFVGGSLQPVWCEIPGDGTGMESLILITMILNLQVLIVF